MKDSDEVEEFQCEVKGKDLLKFLEEDEENFSDFIKRVELSFNRYSNYINIGQLLADNALKFPDI